MKQTLRFGLICAILLGLFQIAVAQNLRLTGFFKPRVSMSYLDMIPSRLNDSINYRNNQFSLNATIPLKVKVGLTKGFRAILLTADVNLRQVFLPEDSKPRNLLNAQIGISGINASLQSGALIYFASLGLEEDLTKLGNLYPAFAGALGKVKVKGLKRQNLYGAGLIFGKELIFPFPLIGFHRMKNLKQGWILLLPFYFKYYKRYSKKFKLSTAITFGGINSTWSANTIPTDPGTPIKAVGFSVFHIRANLRMEYSPTNKVMIFAEVGPDLMKRVRFRDERKNLYSGWVLPQPYMQVGLSWQLPRNNDLFSMFQF